MKSLSHLAGRTVGNVKIHLGLNVYLKRPLTIYFQKKSTKVNLGYA